MKKRLIATATLTAASLLCAGAASAQDGPLSANIDIQDERLADSRFIVSVAKTF